MRHLASGSEFFDETRGWVVSLFIRCAQHSTLNFSNGLGAGMHIRAGSRSQVDARSVSWNPGNVAGNPGPPLGVI